MDLPADELSARVELDVVFQLYICTGEKNVFLRQPFEDAAMHLQSLLLQGERAGATVELGRARCSDQSMSTRLHIDIDIQLVASHHATGGMQQVDVTRLPFRIEGTLDAKRALMSTLLEQGLSSRGREAQADGGLPAGSAVGRRMR